MFEMSRCLEPLGCRILCCLVTVVLLATVVDAADQQADEVVVTLCHFSTSDHSYKNAQAAELLTELTQDYLSETPGIAWVERERIDLALEELGHVGFSSSSTASSLQLGKWLKADLLIKGVFSIQDQKIWRLDLEIIDLQRADVLASRSLSIPKPLRSGRTSQQFPVNEQVVKKVAEQLTGALAEAFVQKGILANQVLVAPLYFQNVDKNSRLDFLERDLQHYFKKQNQQQTRCRYLQFPRSREAYSEADLVASGIVQADHGEWQRIADYYVWGTYQEINSSGVPFEDVVVEIKVKYWDGGTAHGESTLRGTAGNPAKLLRDVVQLVDSISKSKQQGEVDSHVRESIAEAFYRRATSQQVLTLQTEMKDASRLTQRWLRLWDQTKRSLSVATFFDPNSEQIQRELLIETTRDDVPYFSLPNNHELFRLRERSKAWSLYCDKYGFAYELPRVRIFADYPGSMTDNRMFHTSAAMEYLRTAEDFLAVVAGELSASEERREHTDAPEQVIRQWQAEFSRDYLRRLRFVVTNHKKLLQGRMRSRLRMLHYLDSAASQAEFLELIWPLLCEDRLFDGQQVKKKINAIYQELGKPEVAQRMLAKANRNKDAQPRRATYSSPSRQKAESPTYALKLNPVAPVIELPMQPQSVDKWWSVQAVTALDYAGDRLWCGFTGTSRSAEHGHALFSWNNSDEKWLVWKTLNRNNNRATSMLEQDGYLWITFEDEDAIRFELKSGKIKRFTSRDGVPSRKLHASCRRGNTLFFGGGEPGLGVLGSFDLATQKWTQHDLGQYELRGKKIPMPCVKELAGNSEWLAVYAEMYGAFTQLVVLSFRDEPIDAAGMLRQSNPEFSHFSNSWRPKFHGMIFVDGVLWIASSRGLLAFDPALKKFSHVEPLTYELTSVVRNGPMLWFGACPYRGNGTLGDTKRMTCLLLFDTVKKKWIAQVPVPYAGHLMNLALQDETLWLGAGSKGSTVVAVDVAEHRLPKIVKLQAE